MSIDPESRLPHQFHIAGYRVTEQFKRITTVMINFVAKVDDKCGEEDVPTTLPLLDIRKEKKKKIVYHLPCICFGSTQYRIAASCAVHSRSFSTKNHPRKVLHLRTGIKPPTIGELNLLDKHKKLNDTSLRKKTKKSESLLLICQKVEHIKKINKNDRWCAEKSTPAFRFDNPAFPAREEFVFRNRYRSGLPSKLPPKLLPGFLKTLPNKNKIVH